MHFASLPFARRFRLIGRVLIAILLAFAVVPFVLAMQISYYELAVPYGFSLLAIALLAVPFDWASRRFGPKLYAALVAWNPRNRANVTSDTVVNIDVDGLLVHRADGTITIPWSGIDGIDRTDQAVYVYYRLPSRMRTACPLPRRAFETQDSYDAAYQTITRWHRDACPVSSSPA